MRAEHWHLIRGIPRVTLVTRMVTLICAPTIIIRDILLSVPCRILSNPVRYLQYHSSGFEKKQIMFTGSHASYDVVMTGLLWGKFTTKVKWGFLVTEGNGCATLMLVWIRCPTNNQVADDSCRHVAHELLLIYHYRHQQHTLPGIFKQLILDFNLILREPWCLSKYTIL